MVAALPQGGVSPGQALGVGGWSRYPPFLPPFCGTAAARLRGPDPVDSGGGVTLFSTKEIELCPHSHPGRPALVQLCQIVYVGRLFDDTVHLFSDTHPTVRVTVSAF